MSAHRGLCPNDSFGSFGDTNLRKPKATRGSERRVRRSERSRHRSDSKDAREESPKGTQMKLMRSSSAISAAATRTPEASSGPMPSQSGLPDESEGPSALTNVVHVEITASLEELEKSKDPGPLLTWSMKHYNTMTSLPHFGMSTDARITGMSLRHLGSTFPVSIVVKGCQKVGNTDTLCGTCVHADPDLTITAGHAIIGPEARNMITTYTVIPKSTDIKPTFLDWVNQENTKNIKKATGASGSFNTPTQYSMSNMRDAPGFREVPEEKTVHLRPTHPVVHGVIQAGLKLATEQQAEPDSKEETEIANDFFDSMLTTNTSGNNVTGYTMDMKDYEKYEKDIIAREKRSGMRVSEMVNGDGFQIRLLTANSFTGTKVSGNPWSSVRNSPYVRAQMSMLSQEEKEAYMKQPRVFHADLFISHQKRADTSVNVK